MSDDDLEDALYPMLQLENVPCQPGWLLTGDGMLAVIRALGEKDFCCVKLEADYAYCYDVIVMLDKEHTANILITNELAPRAVAEAALLALERTTGEKGEKP